MVRPGGVTGRAKLALHSRDDRCHIRCMANGQAVLVITAPLGGGEPQYTLCYVAEEDAAKAERLVGSLAAPNETVKALGAVPEAAIQAFGLRRGEFRQA
jgi:hypothetical protein